jgi:quercetin dioxygenase-like cupin family protein
VRLFNNGIFSTDVHLYIFIYGVHFMALQPTGVISQSTVNLSIKAQQLIHSSEAWNGKAYGQYPTGTPCISVIKMRVAAHTSLPWHSHTMPSVAYIISGQLTVEDKKSAIRKVINAGEAFNESVGDIHRGYTTELPAEIIITYIAVDGQNLSEPASIESK